MWDLFWSEESAGFGKKTVAHPLPSISCTRLVKLAHEHILFLVNYIKRQHEKTKRGCGEVEVKGTEVVCKMEKKKTIDQKASTCSCFGLGVPWFLTSDITKPTVIFSPLPQIASSLFGN